jgi:iron complex outermembrane receptor protein
MRFLALATRPSNDSCSIAAPARQLTHIIAAERRTARGKTRATASFSEGERAVIRRKRNIIEMAVATAIFGACAAGAMPLSRAAQAAGDTAAQATSDATASPQSGKQSKKDKPTDSTIQLQEVVVNGFVSSLQNSIAIQKNSDTIVEAVSSQEIGQLPGTSIADALSRMPGISAQYFNGRPQQISIHGLSADFDVTQVAGSIQPSTSNNRDVELDQYPQSWFSTIKVYLTPSADLVNQGIAGTIDMLPMKPLDQKRPSATINANYQTIEPHDVMPGPGVSANGHNVDGILADQFLDHTLGITLGVDLESNPYHILHQAPWGYATDANGNLIIGGSKNYNVSDLLDRKGFIGSIEYKPSSALDSTLDLMEEDSNETQQAKGAEFPLGYGSGEVQIPGTTVNGFDTTGTFQNVYPVIRNDYNHYQARVYNIIWNNDFKLSDSWTGTLTAAYGRAEREDYFLESYSGYGYNGPGSEGTAAAFPGTDINFSEGANGKLWLFPSQGLDGSNVVLTDPQGWGSGANLVQAGFINQPHTEDHIARIKASATHYFESGPFSAIELGADYEHRRKDYRIDQAFLVLGGGPSLLLNGGATRTLPIPASALEGAGDPLAFMGVGPEVLYNPFALIASGALALYPTSLSSIAVPPNWSMDEKDTTPYVQLDIHSDLSQSVTLTGNVGVQVAHTNQNSEGERVAPGSSIGGAATTVLLPVSDGTSYTRYLPSLNLKFSLPDENDLLLSVARTMARPRPDYMSASFGINTNVTALTVTNPLLSYFSGSGGNPKLLPTMSTNVNASVTHYFRGPSGGGYNCTGGQSKTSALCTSGGEGYVQLSGYYLKLTDFINPSSLSVFNFAPYEAGYLTPTQQGQLGTSYGILNIPQNDGAGHIEGEQIAANVPLGDFTRWLGGLGVTGSVDRTLSTVHYAGQTSPVTVPGLSKWVENFTVYYQRGGFQASVNDDIRSSFLGEVFGISSTRVEQVFKATSTVDAQMSYEIPSGPLNGLTLIVTGSNLNNHTMATDENGDPRQVLTWEQYPRLYTIGFSYTFQ